MLAMCNMTARTSHSPQPIENLVALGHRIRSESSALLLKRFPRSLDTRPTHRFACPVRAVACIRRPQRIPASIPKSTLIRFEVLPMSNFLATCCRLRATLNRRFASVFSTGRLGLISSPHQCLTQLIRARRRVRHGYQGSLTIAVVLVTVSSLACGTESTTAAKAECISLMQAAMPRPQCHKIDSQRLMFENVTRQCSTPPGTPLTQVAFDSMVEEHESWLSGAPSARRANFCGFAFEHVTMEREIPLCLSGAIFSGANLKSANFRKAMLQGASFCGADMSGDDFSGAVMAGAELWRIKAEETQFVHGDLRNTGMAGAELRNANFWGADLTQAVLRPVRVEGTQFTNANFMGATYDPISGFPNPFLGDAKNIGSLSTESFPTGLLQLRSMAIASGQGSIVREVSALIARTDLTSKWNRSHGEGQVDAIVAGIEMIFVGAPTSWGQKPSLPIAILILAMLVFAGLYAVLIRHYEGLFFRLQPKDAITIAPEGVGLQAEPIITELRPSTTTSLIVYSLLISVQMTFFFASDAIRASNWVNRINPSEETIVALGRARVLGGLQSLLSIYLLAVWVAVAFGGYFRTYSP